MSNADEKAENKNKIQSFERRLDFYWKYIAVYAVAIILYAFIKGSLEGETLTFVFVDPVVILLAVFIVLTALGLLIEALKKKRIVVGEDYVIFSNRFRKKKFTKDEIQRIYIGRERAKYSGKFRIIKVKLKKRRRPIIIRPSSFWNEKELIALFGKLKKKIRNR